MDELSRLPPVRYRVEHHDGERAPIVLGRYMPAPVARAAFQLAVTQHRVAGRAGWIVLIDQAAYPEREMKRLPLSEGSTIH